LRSPVLPNVKTACSRRVNLKGAKVLSLDVPPQAARPRRRGDRMSGLMSIPAEYERVMPARIDASGDQQPWTMLDMHMLVMIGGRERTKDEFQALLAASKFNLKRTLSLPGATGITS
jgi:hypothetical protein